MRVLSEETATAAGLGGAQLAANGVAVVFTVALARMLGRDDYGELIALSSAFMILSVPGYALQAASARAVATGALGNAGAIAARLRRWNARILLACGVLAVVGVVAREPLRSVIGIDSAWAAALTLPTCGLWALLSLQRGVLCGDAVYRPVAISIVAEQAVRLVFAVAVAAAGAGVAGAFAAFPASMALMAFALARVLARHGPALPAAERALRRRDFGREVAPPVAALTLVAILQNVDPIVVRHFVSDDLAGAYAAASVAAKAVVWTAVGVGMYLLPVAARRAAAGEDARPTLARALGVVLAVAAPAVVAFLVAPSLLLRLAFGEQYTAAAGALSVLGIAMSVLGCGYLGVQFLLALGRRSFLLGLGAVAAAEPVLLLTTDLHGLAAFATVVLTAQVAAAAAVLLPSFCRARAGADAPAEPEPEPT